MPYADFKTAGRPRRGQWVWVVKDGVRWLGISLGPDDGVCEFEQLPESAEFRIVAFNLHTPVVRQPLPGFYKVAIVDEATGLETIGEFLIHVDRMTPLTEREAIPAPRLAQMRPGWVPKP